MSALPSLDVLRGYLADRRLLAIFGGIYLVSQVVIVTIVDPLNGDTMLNLQVTAFTAADYLRTFQGWEAAGTMPFYDAHLIFDDVHWIWYSIALSVFLALGLNAACLSSRWNFVLLFPPLAGILDCIENALQHVFLSAPRYQMLIDPLPAISTSASIGKWIFFLSSFLLIALFYLVAPLTRRRTGART